MFSVYICLIQLNGSSMTQDLIAYHTVLDGQPPGVQFDLDVTEAQLQVSFSPIYNCVHIVAAVLQVSAEFALESTYMYVSSLYLSVFQLSLW